MEIVDALTQGSWMNVTPNVVARHARLPAERGIVPESKLDTPAISQGK